ncbi:MAG TPA: sulfatase [Planctomycetaceae bacterium]|nr:sulfatase [Planctomycetaceae bacterium]
MKRPQRLLSFAIAACVLLFEPLSAATPVTTGRPNILFIIVDDQSPFDLKPYAPESQLDAPNIERIAREGMVIENAYQMGAWSGAVCTASRHMVMSGRTVWHIPNKAGRKRNPHMDNGNLVPAGLERNTLAAVFNRAGYDTMRTCKKGNSYAAANKQFTVVRDASKRGGTAETGSAWHAEQVLDYLAEREASSDEDPFLIYFGFSHPHDTRDGTPELLAKYGATNHTEKDNPPALNAKQPALPINYLPAHPFHHGHPGLRDEEQVSGVWDRRDEATIRNEIGRQFACSENIDIQIGRVLDKLDAMGELDNTFVVYTSDHGMAIGRHGLQGKQNLYDHTWRVPMIVKGPGIAAGSRARGNVYLLDVLATLCDMADIAAPETNEGLSFEPILTGKQKQSRDVVYGVYTGGTKPGMRCIRKGDWKLIKYDVLDGTVRKTQLFNLRENPHEFLDAHRLESVQFLAGCKPGPLQTNLAGHSEYSEKLAEMESLLLAEMQRLDDPYRLWDQPAN